MFSKSGASVSATPVYKYRAEVEKFLNAGASRTPCELQRTFSIDHTVKIIGTLLIRMMYTSSKMNDRFHLSESSAPICRRTDRLYLHVAAD